MSGRAAHVDDRAIELVGEEGSPAHRVGRTGRECRYRVAPRVVDVHERPVVLAEEDGGADAGLGHGPDQPGGDGLGELAQGGIDDRGVLPPEQPHPADLVGEADRRTGSHLGDDLRRPQLELGVDRREDRRDGEGPGTGVERSPHRVAHLPLVEIVDAAAVVLVAAMAEIAVAADRAAQPFWPVHQRRKGAGGGQTEADGGGLGEVGAFGERIAEVGRPDHHGRYLGVLEPWAGPQPGDGAQDAAVDVWCRGDAGRGDDPALVHKDRVGVGVADVDP